MPEPARLDFGKHCGELVTRVPVSYLKWMIREGVRSDLARAELERRGTTTPELEVSGHAVDRFSQRFLEVWLNERVRLDAGPSDESWEGLWTFVNRVATEAWAKASSSRPTSSMPATVKVGHAGVTWTFATTGTWPVVKTVT